MNLCSGIISVLKPRWSHVLRSQEWLEEKGLGMKAQQQQKRNEWMRAAGTLASAPGLVAILWEPKGEGATQDTVGGSCEALHLTKYSTA